MLEEMSPVINTVLSNVKLLHRGLLSSKTLHFWTKSG